VDEILPRTLNRILPHRHAAGLGRPALDERVRAQLADRLADDVRRLRVYMPEGFDGWGIA
jgi:hypothetical protein